jgi:hypothetical protein
VVQGVVDADWPGKSMGHLLQVEWDSPT